MEQVKVAVQSLHLPTVDHNTRQQALRFLEHFQNTVEAWNFSLEILENRSSTPTSSVELLFFAAQTLKHKIIADFVQLSAEMTMHLRKTLWELTIEKPISVRMVKAQLDLAVAALAVQCSENLWNDPVGELLKYPSLSLSILTAIPEQLSNPLIHLSETEHESQRCRLLQQHMTEIIQLSANLLTQSSDQSSANNEISHSVISCLQSWIKYGAADINIVSSPDLLQLTFNTLLKDLSLRRQSAGDISANCDLICEIFFRFFQLADTPSPQFLHSLSTGLLQLRSTMLELIKEGNDSDIDGSDNKIDELSSEYSAGDEPLYLTVGRVFLEAGEAFIPFIFDDQPQQPCLSVIVEVAMALAEQPHSLRTVETTFSFWSALETRLSQASEQVREAFIPVFSRLFRSLTLTHLPFPETDNMTAEARDAFRDFRHVIGDCLKDCTRVMGSTEALTIVAQLLEQTMSTASTSVMEAILFSLRTISSSVDRRESEMMPHVASLLLQIANSTTTSHRLVYAVILNIGCYADWLRYHSDYLPSFLTILAANLKEHSAAASMALKYVCESCGSILKPHEPILRSLYLQGALNLASSRDVRDLTEAIVHLLGTFSEEEQNQTIPEYLNLWATVLTTRPVDSLENISIFIGSLHSQIISSFIQQLLPMITGPQAASVTADVLPSLIDLLKIIALNHPQYSSIVIDSLDQLLLTQSNGGSANILLALRHLCQSDPPIIPWIRVRQTMEKALSTSIANSPGELLLMIAAIVDFYDEVIMDELLSIALDMATKSVISAPQLTPIDVSNALLLATHTLSRLSSATGIAHHPSLPAALTSIMHSTLQALSLLPHSVLPDAASFLRRFHLYDPAHSMALSCALIDALPGLVDRERGVWKERYRTSMEAVKPREAKEFLLAFTSVMKRRLNTTI